MAGEETATATREDIALGVPWNVIIHDDPVNLMDYVTRVLQRVFNYQEQYAIRLMLEVHQLGRSVVWTGQREKAEFFVQQLQLHQLKTTLEKAA
jgi:ATP-dependent Clp protease adaptor protein ClpS